MTSEPVGVGQGRKLYNQFSPSDHMQANLSPVAHSPVKTLRYHFPLSSVQLSLI